MNTETPEWVANVEVIVCFPTGETRNANLRIGKPYKVSQHWRCPVDLGEPHGRGADIGGESSMQALALSISFITKILSSLKEKGYSWLDPFSKEMLPMEDIFDFGKTDL